MAPKRRGKGKPSSSPAPKDPSSAEQKGKAPVRTANDNDGDFSAMDFYHGDSDDEVNGGVGLFDDSEDDTPRTPVQVRKRRKSFHTPNHGIQKDSSRPSLTDKVQEVSIYGDLCSLKYQSSACNANEVSHALRRADGYTDLNKMDSLCYHWKRGPDGINLDSRSNISIVDTTLHRVGDSGGYAILPKNLPKILDLALENAKLSENDKIPFEARFTMPKDGWPSELLPLDIDPSHVITRSRVVRVRAGENKWKVVGKGRQHSHPYRNFGTIRTHVHPFFRIADAHTKNLEPRSFWTDKQVLAAWQVESIMELWLKTAPDDFVEGARLKRAEHAQKLKERRDRRRAKKNDQPEAGPSNHGANEDPFLDL